MLDRVSDRVTVGNLQGLPEDVKLTNREISWHHIVDVVSNDAHVLLSKVTPGFISPSIPVTEEGASWALSVLKIVDAVAYIDSKVCQLLS